MNMILLNWEGRDRTFASLEEATVKLKIEPLDEEVTAQIKRRSAKGDRTFGCINPFQAEINDRRCGIFCNTPEELETLRCTMKDET
jgi:hypothetical protein